MTRIKTIMAPRPEELDAAVNAALREDEVWARPRATQTHDHDGWLVAVLVYDARDAPRTSDLGREGVAMTEENWQRLAEHRPEDPEGVTG
jgi:hypothetical protein